MSAQHRASATLAKRNRSRRANLQRQIQTKAGERHEAYREGGQPRRTLALASDLEHLHEEKRDALREAHDFDGLPEGTPYRGRTAAVTH